ncbi:uroporphyrinogen-III C-methyltransferase [Enterovibrio sp. ZSDZ35]|uniref:uroporphyrinogen-III C-methyltransferase n=1 Tax=Enterovibrio qingdaonensis TaxID=2899818 RepID=A0ABT5QNZ2_9GAMM|nr:uroporphyrinogen-III C-methyltransferase [Enterovibrio sp. ZSDZ35]MDD1782705.1 uroporphyrinogen-III C-methyltransferase [Enterovibrio sp. ZSDZ35]
MSKRFLEECVSDAQPSISQWRTSTRRARGGRPKGRVVLVGAGPGDPELLTMKAYRCIQSADVVVYDRLVSSEIVDLIPSGKALIYVGKAKGLHSVPQDKINDILVAEASAGRTVCRLKGGDSFIFGRGGEEMKVLRDAGVNVEVIPGITAASGCTSYAGIPLTHRGLSQGCTLVTAHAEKDLSSNWSALASLNHTLVFYMGLSKLQFITEKLMAEGMSPSMPIAVIEKGCSVNQRVFVSTLSDVLTAIQGKNLVSPSLIVVGEVVSLSSELSWFVTQTQEEIEQLSA